MTGKSNRRSNQQGVSPNNRAWKRTPTATTPVRQNQVRENSVEQNVSSGANTPPRANLSSERTGSEENSHEITPRELEGLLEAAVQAEMEDNFGATETEGLTCDQETESAVQPRVTQRSVTNTQNPYQQNRMGGRTGGRTGGRAGGRSPGRGGGSHTR